MEGWTAAYHAAEVRSGAARQTAQRLGWAHDRHHLFRRNTSITGRPPGSAGEAA